MAHPVRSAPASARPPSGAAATLPGVAAPGGPVGAAGSPGDGIGDAMRKAGRLLALRPRTAREMRDRLALAGFDTDVVDAAVARLEELRLVDDLAFAVQWIEERSRRGRGPAALSLELEAKGVDAETAGHAFEVAGVDEGREAQRWAERLLPKVNHWPLRYQASYLHAALARRGYSPEATEDAIKAVLPPDGWD